MIDLKEYKIMKYTYPLSNDELTKQLWDNMDFNETKWAVKLTLEGISATSDGSLENAWDIIFLEPKLEKNIDRILYKYNIEYVKEDITEFLLNDSSVFGEDFLGKLEDYLQENLTVDDILDNINVVGIENMSIFERYYLDRSNG